ncbi:kinase-like domain-containing protein [Cyathus striatus]|nr:kinase-like domain-containing protein [Cyathus striatus]
MADIGSVTEVVPASVFSNGKNEAINNLAMLNTCEDITYFEWSPQSTGGSQVELEYPSQLLHEGATMAIQLNAISRVLSSMQNAHAGHSDVSAPTFGEIVEVASESNINVTLSEMDIIMDEDTNAPETGAVLGRTPGLNLTYSEVCGNDMDVQESDSEDGNDVENLVKVTDLQGSEHHNRMNPQRFRLNGNVNMDRKFPRRDVADVAPTTALNNGPTEAIDNTTMESSGESQIELEYPSPLLHEGATVGIQLDAISRALSSMQNSHEIEVASKSNINVTPSGMNMMDEDTNAPETVIVLGGTQKKLTNLEVGGGHMVVQENDPEDGNVMSTVLGAKAEVTSNTAMLGNIADVEWTRNQQLTGRGVTEMVPESAFSDGKNEANGDKVIPNAGEDITYLEWNPQSTGGFLIEQETYTRGSSSWSGLHSDACDILREVCSNKTKYKKLLSLDKSTSQLVLDVMQMIIDNLSINSLDLRFENILLKAMLRLSKCSTLCPRSYVLSDIKRDEYPTSSGHFGEVFQGNYNGRKVALKVFKLYSSEMSKINNLLKAFFKEAILWRRLAHRNLLPFYGIYHLGDSGGRICLVSPWMNNGNITQYLQRNPGVNRQNLALDIARGIAYLHEKWIIHGDLKGVNVLISDNGVACLADFGLSSIINAHSLIWTSIESTVSNAGTIRWQAPELLDEESVGSTKESDVYAFACVCYEVFVGKVPFYQYSFDPTVMRQLMLGYRPLKPELNSAPYTHYGLTDWMWSLVEKCWCQDPASRPEASEVVEKLSSRKEFLRNGIHDQDSWGDLRPEVFKSLIVQRYSISEADIKRSISLFRSL